jgi:tRNA (guanine37-N1)-methyltransferase
MFKVVDNIMWIGVISIFPEMFNTITYFGITGRAIRSGIITIKVWNPRDFTQEKNRAVDSRPYGGGPGMLLAVEPLRGSIHAAKAAAGNGVRTVYLSPQGRKLDQSSVHRLSQYQKLILVCGRYEGIDERIIDKEIDEEWSIGDYVVSGGELPAMVVIDAVSRLVPGVLGKQESAYQDSFSNGLMDFPHYTKPRISPEGEVPPVLLSGNHANIQRWRLKQSLGRTWARRAELLESLTLSDEQIQLLDEFKEEYQE